MRWLSDVAGTLTSLGIPWSLWDYCSEDFGVARCGPTPTPLDPDVARALGLGAG